MSEAEQYAAVIKDASELALKITKVGLPYWERTPTDGRRGPWLTGSYQVVNNEAWLRPEACLYMVMTEGKFHYFGISRQRLKTRWRESPALDPGDRTKIIGKRIFHSQCWKPLQIALSERPHLPVYVYVIHGRELRAILATRTWPLAGFLALGDDDEGLVAAVERWFCNRQTESFANWNTAMTLKSRKKA